MELFCSVTLYQPATVTTVTFYSYYLLHAFTKIAIAYQSQRGRNKSFDMCGCYTCGSVYVGVA